MKIRVYIIANATNRLDTVKCYPKIVVIFQQKYYTIYEEF